MKPYSLDLIRNFLAVARCRSFTAAAHQLDVSPTAVSKAVRTFERQHGIILFQRTTRCVSLTEAGAGLFERLSAATAQIDDAFAALTAFRARPAGKVRITAPRALGAIVARRLVPRMRQAYPEIELDLSLNDGIVDLVRDGYDVGIRLGQALQQDMVAVRLSGDLAWSVAASPAYLQQAGTPKVPQDLLQHRTIRYRYHTAGTLPGWRFVLNEEEVRLHTGTELVVNDTSMIAEFARQGLGLAYLPDIEIADDLAAGRLQRVLAPFVPTTPGLFLYFPVRTQSQPKLRALIDEAVALTGKL
jgi:DNA-binding transcriptional LysR family regulator